MKTALVCIAKNEDNYIDEWLKYHTKLGFTDIYVYQNNWRYNGDKTQFNNVNWIEFDGNAKQLAAYNNFIKFNSINYDWSAFFDIDEFLCIKNFYNVDEFLKCYEDYNAVGINWRMFGDNNLEKPIDNNYSLVNRFTKAAYVQDQHIKTILHTSKIDKENTIFINPHFVSTAVNYNFTINIKKTAYIHGAFNTDFDNTAQLNHYYTKTLNEYLNNKRIRGRADLLITQDNNQYDLVHFNAGNKNDIEDLYAYKFFNNIV